MVFVRSTDRVNMPFMLFQLLTCSKTYNNRISKYLHFQILLIQANFSYAEKFNRDVFSVSELKHGGYLSSEFIVFCDL